MEMIRCRACGEEKRPDEMSRSSNGTRCKACRRAVNAAWLSDPEARERQYQNNREYRARNKEKLRRQKIRANYGLGPDEYDRMLGSQQGRCAICQDVCPSGKSLAVDHCHKTGQVRGLLCSRCNPMLGYARDSPELLYRAVLYLARWQDLEDSPRPGAFVSTQLADAYRDPGPRGLENEATAEG